MIAVSLLGRTNMHTQAGYLANSQANAFRMLYPQLAYANYPGNLAALALATQGQYPYEYAHTLVNHMNFAMETGLSTRKSMTLSPNSSLSDGKDDRYIKNDCGKLTFTVAMCSNCFLLFFIERWITFSHFRNVFQFNRDFRVVMTIIFIYILYLQILCFRATNRSVEITLIHL